MIFNDADRKRYNRIKIAQNVISFTKVLLFFCVLVLSIFSVYNIDFGGKKTMQELTRSKAYINGPECGNMTFQDTAICLNDFARKNFFYNITDDSLTLTIKDMMERGGDCRDFSIFYKVNMASYGFENSEIIKLFIKSDGVVATYHVYLSIGSESGYCNMDIMNLECYNYNNGDDE